MGQFFGGLPPGTLLDRRYRVIRLVGKGGFGAVYEAFDDRFQGGRVAVKELTPSHLDPAKRAAAIANSRREGNLLRSLDHPNLPKVTDFFEENGNAYLVMDFIIGKTLKQELADRGEPLDQVRVMSWALELCDVLYYLHSHNPSIIFRDLKPANVMLTTTEQIKLIDFGIARFFKPTADQDTHFALTPGYAPLEQYGQGQTDERSDVYALGATLFTLLTNAVPADSLTRQLRPHMFRTPRQINSSISPETEDIILKAMAGDPKYRYQSALEMYQAIVMTGIGMPRPSSTLYSRFFQQNSVLRPWVSTTTHPATPLPTPVPPSQPQPAEPPLSGPYQPPGPTSAPISGPYQPPGPTSAPISGPYPLPGPATAPISGSYQPPQLVTPPIPGPYPQPVPQKQDRGVSRRSVLIGLGAAAAVAVGAGFYFFSKSGGPVGPVGPTITVNFIYSTEKQKWIQTVTNTFNQKEVKVNGKSIQVVAAATGSVNAIAGITNGSLKPTAWSPASFLELNQLSSDWKRTHSGSDIIFSSGNLIPMSLLISPLVFAIWKERASVLLSHYGSIDWSKIHDALTKSNWSQIGGQSAWGTVKFGQTSPLRSNSGLLTITLIAYAALNKQRDLTVTDVNSPQFQSFFHDIENAVNAFGQSSGTFLGNVVLLFGPAAYDITTTYENLVLQDQAEAMERQHQPLQLFYPSTNILSNHPFAVLNGDWMTLEEQQAAAMYRDFLLDIPQQQLALASGFRPTNLSVSINDKVSNNLFRNQWPDIHLSQQIQSQAQAPNGDVVNALLALWMKNYGTAPLTTGDLDPKLSSWTLG